MTTAKDRLSEAADKVREVTTRPDVTQPTEELKETARRTKADLVQSGLKLSAALAGVYLVIKLALKVGGSILRVLRDK